MSKNIGKEVAAIIGALVALLAAGVLVWFIFKKLAIADADVSVFALILLPMLIYMVLSGRIKELKGPGGIEARFAGFASETVDPRTEQITESIQEMEDVVKGGSEVLKSRVKDLDPKKPHNLILRLGTQLTTGMPSKVTSTLWLNPEVSSSFLL